MTTPVTDATFDAEVLGGDLPVVVDFWADWCTPCKLVAPVLAELSEVYEGRLRVVSVDTDANPQVRDRYGIVSIPALYYFAGGELVRSTVGARPKAVLSAEFDEVLAEVAAG